MTMKRKSTRKADQRTVVASWDRFMFVGERRSNKAISMKVTWKHGRLAASTLFRALCKLGFDPLRSRFYNLWYDDNSLNVMTIRFVKTSSCPVVALGRRVSKELTAMGIKHISMIHPAARGSIRKKDKYDAHVADMLTGSGIERWAYA